MSKARKNKLNKDTGFKINNVNFTSLNLPFNKYVMIDDISDKNQFISLKSYKLSYLDQQYYKQSNSHLKRQS